MVSILRSPEFSEQKRKLSTRRARARQGAEGEVVLGGEAAEAIQAPDPEVLKNLNAREVRDLVEQARLAVLDEFKNEAEAARELGRQRGLREGRQAGTEEAKQSFAVEIARVKSIADKLPMAQEAGIHGLEDMALAIAFEAVCKVLGPAVVTREGVQALVRQAATHALNSEKVVVRLHAADLAMLRETGAVDAALPSGALVTWLADKEVALGGCVIETDGGELDARLETQVDRLRAAMVTARRSVSGPEPDIEPDRRKKRQPNYSPDRRKSSRRTSEG